MNYRKTLLAAVMVVPLALTACGSDEETADNAASSTSADSSTSAKATDKPDEDKKDDKDKKDEDKDENKDDANKPSGENKPEGEGADRPAGENGDNNADNADRPQGNNAPAPAGGGNAADEKAINDLVHGMDDGGNNMQALAYYTIDNSCTAYLNANGGEAKLRSEAKTMVNPATGQPLSFSDFEQLARQTGAQVPANMGMAKIQKVENVRINGDTATAFVTSDQNSADMNFTREGGKWKICPAG